MTDSTSQSLQNGKQRNVWWRLLGLIGSHWPLCIVAVVGMALDSLAQSGFIYLLRPLIDQGFSTGNSIGQWLPLAMFGLIVLRVTGNFAGIYTMEWLGRKIVASLRQQLFNQYLVLPKRFFDQHSAGDLVSKLTYNTDQVAHATTNGMITAIRDSFTVTALLVVMLLQSPTLTAALAVLLPVVALIVGVISRRFRKISRKIQQSMGGLTHITDEAVRGHAIVKLFAGQRYEQQRFEQTNEHNRRLHQRLIATQLASSSLVQIFAGVALLLVLFLATQQRFELDITAGTFMSVLGAMVAMIAPLKRLTNVHALIQKAIAAADSVFKAIDEAGEQDNGSHLSCSDGHINFSKVTFCYPGRKQQALSGISLDITPGTVTALVGRSGSGKTTLAALVTRFYSPDTGSVSLDGVSLEDWQLEGLRDQMAYVGQDVVLFNDTLRNNIAYGALQDKSEQAIQAAIRCAHVDEFAEQLPQGLETIVGDRGHLLSGGQRQRVALARALLKDAPVLILDEATSSLDNISQQFIQDALQQVMQNRTVLIIAHRLSTIEHADNIVMMVDGRIVEQGRHAELLAADGAYTALHRIQLAAGG